MYFESWSDFLIMGGHGLYVWSAYAVAIVIVLYNIASPILAKRKVVANIKRQERLAKGSGKRSLTAKSLLFQDRGTQ